MEVKAEKASQEVDPLSEYEVWLKRFNNVLNAYHAKNINDDELTKFQLFLLLSGQLNANFTSSELTRLGYPKFPFAAMHEHNYLRFATTWAMEIFSKHYQRKLGHESGYYPIWVSSKKIWMVLEFYSRVITIEKFNFNDCIEELVSESEVLNISKEKIIFKFLPNNFSKNYIQNFSTSILTNLEAAILDYYVKKEFQNSEEEIKNFFECVIQGKNYNKEDTTNLLDALGKKFKKVKEESDEKYINTINTINSIRKDELGDKENLKLRRKLYNILKKELKNYDINNLTGFLELEIKELRKTLKDIIEKLRPKKITINSYENVIKDTFTKYQQKKIAEIVNNSAFCIEDSYQKIDAIVAIGVNIGDADAENTEAPGFLLELINSLGYRVDAVHIIRKLIELYPKIFINAGQTKEFWAQLMKTAMIENLPEKDKNNILMLGKTVFDIINKSKFDDVLNSYDIFTKKYIEFKNRYLPSQENILSPSSFSISTFLGKLKNDISEKRRLYFNYIYDILNLYENKFKKESNIRHVLDKEISEIICDFIKNENDMKTIVRCAQSIAEIFNLLTEVLRSEKEKLLEFFRTNFSGATQDVLYTPYAMSAFTQVFYMLANKISKDAPLNIFLSNQSYYELLSNVITVKRDAVFAKLVQTLEDIDKSAELIFIEIHQNNVVAGQNFKHSVEDLFYKMKMEWADDKIRTVVIDATLNMLDGSDIKKLINSNKTYIDNKSLRLIFIQSLTKFSQLGLDLRSGGLIIEVCHKDIALGFSEFQQENDMFKMDCSTQKYFNHHLLFDQSLLSEYLLRITKNCYTVYTKVLEKINQCVFSNKNNCQLMICSDRGSCYIGLKFKGLLFQLNESSNTENYKNFDSILGYIVKYLLIPLCEKHNLPLSQRESIGFPLSSINVAVDSWRFTVGLESNDELEKYAEIIFYVIKVINSIKVKDVGGLNEEENCKEYFNAKVQKESRFTDYVNPTGINKTPNTDLFGPYESNYYSYYFLLSTTEENKFCIFLAVKEERLLINMYLNDCNRLYNSDGFSRIKKGNIITNIHDIPFDDIKYFIQESSYKTSEVMEDFTKLSEIFAGIRKQYIPLISDLKFDYQPENLLNSNDMKTEQIELERDIVCAKSKYVTVYKRKLQDEKSVIEIDFWGIKNPSLARILSLMTAVYVKEKFNVDFIARDCFFNHYLFNFAFSNADNYFQKAIVSINSCHSVISNLLSVKSTNKDGKYNFTENMNLEWPSGNKGIRSFYNKQLITEGLSAINKSTDDIINKDKPGNQYSADNDLHNTASTANSRQKKSLVYDSKHNLPFFDNKQILLRNVSGEMIQIHNTFKSLI